MWDKLHGAFTSATTLFGKEDGKHSKCPRCKGSGLLTQHAVKNDPCWFCEGSKKEIILLITTRTTSCIRVGVMPIAGLKGFLVSRATAILRTEDYQLQVRLPENGLPRTQCKFQTLKADTSDLLFSIQASPPWMLSNNGLDNPTKGRSVSETLIALKSQGANNKNTITTKNKNKNKNKDKDKVHDDRPPNMREVESPNIAKLSRTMAMTIAKPKEEEDGWNPNPNLNPVMGMDKLEEDGRNPHPRLNHGRGGLIEPRTKVEWRGRETRFRSARRKRSCIREKAEKAALERAQRIQRLLTPCHQSSALLQNNDQGHKLALDQISLTQAGEVRNVDSKPFLLAILAHIQSMSNLSLPSKAWIDGVIPRHVLGISKTNKALL